MSETTPTSTSTSAEIFPFPLRRTLSWRCIADEHARRQGKAKVAYAEKVINGNIERLRGLGVSQRRIDAEVASLQSVFDAMSSSQSPAKVRA